VTEPIAAGREADVFALDDLRVLRRYRNGGDATDEARIMAYVSGLGYPVPEVFEASGPDLIMERVTGPTMVQAFFAGDLGLAEAARMLADLLAHLHTLPVWPGAEPGASILHLDLHPENVMLTDRGPVVIDWRNATPGEADLDTGFTALILAQIAIGSIAHPLGDGADAGKLLDLFLPLAPGDPTRLLDDVVAMRAQQSTMSPEEIRELPTAAARVRTGR
jgi:aminoglycoside phosphotransferase (APT) family kinase protein